MGLKNLFSADPMRVQQLSGPLAPGQDPSSMTRNIPGYSPFQNKLAEMGGLNNILSQDDMMSMSNKDLDAYNKSMKTAKGQGMSDLLYAIGSGVKGEDFLDPIQKRRDARTEAAEADDKRFKQNEMARLYKSGDTEGAMAIALELGDKSVMQGIVQERNRIANRPKRSSDGRYLINYDADGTPQYTLDEDLQEQELNYQRQLTEIKDAKKNKPGASFLNKELTQVEQIADLDRVSDGAAYFAEQMKEGNLNLSRMDNFYDAVKNNITGNLFTTEAGQKEFMVNKEYDRFLEKLRATSLALQTGTKTDMDAELAMAQVESSRDPEEFQAAMKELERINRERANLKRSVLLDQRSELGYEIPGYLQREEDPEIKFEEIE